MTLVAYTKIKTDRDTGSLWAMVENSFSRKENEEYFNEIRKRKNQDSIKESLSALLVLAELLEKADIPSSDLILDRQDSGKPRFTNSQIEFSLTHSRGYAAAAISDTSKVGIDLEATEIPPEKAARLAERFFTDDEQKYAKESPDSALRLWTKKEAYAKMLGTPLSELIAIEKKTPNTKRENAFFYELSADGHPLTVCLEKSCKITDLGAISI